MKKIVFINKNLWSFNNFRYQLAYNLSKKYDVYCLYGGSNTNSKKKIKNVKYLNIGLSQKPIDPINDLKYVIRLIFFLKKNRPDIVHCFNPKPVLLSFLSLFYFKNIKLFLTITGLGHSFLTKNKILRALFNTLYFFSFLKADLIFFQNNLDFNLFKNKGFLKNKKTFKTIGLGIRISKNLKTKKIRDKISFAFVSRVTKEKGIFEYLYAIKRIQESNNNLAKFYVVKNFDENSLVGLDLKKLNYLIKELDIKMSFLEYDTNIKRLYDKFDILVFPSYREGASKTLMEACNFGKVILASNVAGCNNIVQNKKNGFLFKSGSIDALYNSLNKVLDNKKKLKVMAKHSRIIAKQKFEEVKILKRVEKFYR